MELCTLDVLTNELDQSLIIVIGSNIGISQDEVLMLKSLQRINVIARQNTVSLSTSVSDDEFVKVWNEFVQVFSHDFIEFEKRGFSYIAQYIVNKFKIYSDLFSVSRFDLSKFMGLFGELCFINDFYKRYGSLIIDNWGQPGSQRVDFNFKKEIFEIKSIGESSEFIKLSSTKQLNIISERNLFVVVYKLRIERGKNQCFSNIIQSIRNQLKSNYGDLFRFNLVLKDLGLYDEQNYISVPYDFVLQSTDFYFIDESFPQFVDCEGYTVSGLSLSLSLLEKFNANESFKIS